jgi:hypothetical protein
VNHRPTIALLSSSFDTITSPVVCVQLLSEVVIKPMAACRTLRSCFHSADYEALGPPDSREVVQTWSIWI